MFRLMLLSLFCCSSLLAGNVDSMISTYLSRELKQYSRFEFSLVSSVNGTFNYTPDSDRHFERYGNTAYIPVTVTAPGARVFKANLQIKLKLYRNAFTSLVNLRAGEELQPGQFEFTECEVASVNEPVTDALAPLVTYRLRAMVRKGEVLSFTKIEMKPAVYPGDRVIAYKTLGSVEISFDASVRNPGKVGEVIQIVGNDKKIYRARVEGPNSVQVIE